MLVPSTSASRVAVAGPSQPQLAEQPGTQRMGQHPDLPGVEVHVPEVVRHAFHNSYAQKLCKPFVDAHGRPIMRWCRSAPRVDFRADEIPALPDPAALRRADAA